MPMTYVMPVHVVLAQIKCGHAFILVPHSCNILPTKRFVAKKHQNGIKPLKGTRQKMIRLNFLAWFEMLFFQIVKIRSEE